jgi:hypothetical protein
MRMGGKAPRSGSANGVQAGCYDIIAKHKTRIVLRGRHPEPDNNNARRVAGAAMRNTPNHPMQDKQERARRTSQSGLSLSSHSHFYNACLNPQHRSGIASTEQTRNASCTRIHPGKGPVSLIPFHRPVAVILKQVLEIRTRRALPRYIAPTRHVEAQLARIPRRAIRVRSATWRAKRCDAVAVVHREAVSRGRRAVVAPRGRERGGAGRRDAGAVAEAVAGCGEGVGGEVCAVGAAYVCHGGA